ncbi:MAG: hypothetical protein AAGI30_09760 [Planctomycetota bacterium]
MSDRAPDTSHDTAGTATAEPIEVHEADLATAESQARSVRPRHRSPRPPRDKTFVQRLESFISRLSTRNNFWHRVCSMIWLPYAFRSGIRMLNKDSAAGEPFEAMLPFRPFNKNWYNAMAGASLLGSAEVAGGMAIFKTVGGDYRVVCKELTYRFLRPCFGPAVYRVEPEEPIEPLVDGGGEFNIRCKINIFQGLTTPGEREKRVGRCFVTFHVSPKEQHRAPAKPAKKAKAAPTP